MAEELKACPFCGGEPNLTHSDYVHDDLRPMPVVECKSCSAWVRAEDWNRRAKALSQGGEAVAVVAWRTVRNGDNTFPRLHKTERDAQSLAESCNNGPRITKEPLMTVAQHQRILSSSAGSAEPIAMKTHGAWDGLDDLKDLPDGTKLYTHPADQVADDLTMVKVSRELLERIIKRGMRLPDETQHQHLEELRALLAKP